MKHPSKTSAILIVAMLLSGVATSVALAALVGRYAYDQSGDRKFVCNTSVLEQSPYDYYWGGYNTITGGHDGVMGTNGWYYYKFRQ